jgi:prepilin-type N-terminal cleavage/methylation domain-containing protein
MMNRAFSLIELIVASAIVGILIAATAAGFARSREQAKQTQCASNLHQIGEALLMYASDNDGLAPPVLTKDYQDERNKITGNVKQWRDDLLAYTKSRSVFFCPDDPHAGSIIPNPGVDRSDSLYTSYTTDFGAVVLTGPKFTFWVDNPQKAFLPYAEDKLFYVVSGDHYEVRTFHGDMRSQVYFDGHAVTSRIVSKQID